MNLTRPEKALLVSALCFMESDIAPTIDNLKYFTPEFIRETLDYPGIKDILDLIDPQNTKSLYEKLAGDE